MANNQYVNKVVFGSATLVDLTGTTATADKILSGYGAFGADGAWMNGTATQGEGTGGHVWQDAQGYVHLDDEGTPSVTVEALSVTANGTYTAPTGTAYSPVTVNVSGGESASALKKQINFIDYDGAILHSYTSAEWASVTALPSNPSHTGLTAQGWNWTKAGIDAQLTAQPDADIWVGQMYITSSGDTEIDVIFADSARLSPIMSICVNGTITVDWGDGTSADTVTGTSLITRLAVPHTYASAGSYMITIHVDSGEFRFYGTSAYTLLRKNTTANENRVYSNCIQSVRLGNGVTSIDNNAFYNCSSLASITIPDGVTSIGTYAFYKCYSLASITIPDGVTSIGIYAFTDCYSLASITIPDGVMSIVTYAFNNCSSLASITIPDGVTSIGTYAFNNCFSLASITIPDGVTSIGTSAFSGCYSLASITIPDGVTSIDNNAFYNCYGIAEYHILPSSVPTLGTNVFNNIVSDCVIYVPSESLEAYQTATNWSTYASYMQGE